MEKKIILLCAFIFLIFFWAGANKAQAGGSTYIAKPISEAQHWTKEGSPYVITNFINVDAPIVIDPGVVVKFYTGAGLSINNYFLAVGKEDEKIVFTSIHDDSFGGDTNNNGNNTVPKPGYWGSLSFHGGEKEVIIDNALIYYGSPVIIIRGSISVYSDAKNVAVTNTEIKYGGFAGVTIHDSNPIIEKCLISDSKYGIYTKTLSSPRADKIHYNSIINNTYGAYVGFKVNGEYNIRLDLQNNWWGDKSGPYYKHTNYGQDNLGGKGNPVSDGVIFSPWLFRDPLKKREPVVFVPGIGASVNLDTMISGIMNDKWQLFDHTYDGIIEAFKKMGYEEGKDFFIAYYDWRNKNEDSARDYLEPLIKEANSLNGTSKVNIIAHSMGGLVARSYIQSDDYDDDVDNLFLIGTPNKGASDVYPVWEGGRIPNNWDIRPILKIYLSYLTFKLPTSNYYETIHEYIPSVKQLMPIYSYIYPKDNPQDIKNYSEMSEVNNWLVNLNTGIQKLNDRVKVSIISGNNQNTINNIPVISVDNNPLWVDGKPDPLDPQRNDSAGDNRVLLSSAQIQSLYNDIFNDTHGGIVSQSEQLIASRINESLDNIYFAPDVPSEMGFWFASPVDVEIKDPQGRIISGSANEIPLAKYASESKPDGVKIISIPNPVKGDYEIKITGNGSGNYHIGSEYMDYEEGKNDMSSLLEGMINTNETRSYIVEYDPSNPEHLVTPAFPKGLDAIRDYLNDQKELGTIDFREVDFLLTKLKVIKHLAERANDKENVAENYQEQVVRQIDRLIVYIQEKSDKKNKGTIDEPAEALLIESLNFIKFNQLTNI